VLLSGPVLNSGGHLSVLASGNFKIPFWASPPSTILELQVSLASDSPDSLLESFPNINLVDSDRDPSIFTLRGELAGKNLEINNSQSIHSIFATLLEPVNSLLPTPNFEFILTSSEIFTNNS
jgi:hypothetical protein